jgi:hypothetical protein
LKIICESRVAPCLVNCLNSQLCLLSRPSFEFRKLPGAYLFVACPQVTMLCQRHCMSNLETIAMRRIVRQVHNPINIRITSANGPKRTSASR